MECKRLIITKSSYLHASGSRITNRALASGQTLGKMEKKNFKSNKNIKNSRAVSAGVSGSSANSLSQIISAQRDMKVLKSPDV